MNFGEHEGLHFDNLSNSEKERFSSPDFVADGGESWPDVRLRAQTYMKAFENDSSHLLFTHGGLMAAYLNHWFDDRVSSMPPNGSFVGIHLKTDQSGEPDSLDF